jgi:hypothetical protein
MKYNRPDSASIIRREDWGAFENDPYVAQEVRGLVREYSVQTIVETGTYHGDTTVFLAGIAKHVITIEADPRYDNSHLSQFPNVEVIIGDSAMFLGWALHYPAPYLFFLDAHWTEPTPTPRELLRIAELKIHPIIVIHDVQVPDHPELGFDRYNDFTYNIETIRPYLTSIYGGQNYRYYYNHVAAGEQRGVLFCVPT